ncbi:MAG: hypothetical protein AAGI30_07960 [Planctomycetota bacterium]
MAVTLGGVSEQALRVDGVGALTDPSIGTGWWVAAAIGVGVLLVLGWMGLRYGRRTGDPEEDAFLGLCRAVRLGRSDRKAIRTLASAIEAKPVALLLCRSALRRAAHLTAADEPPAAQRRRIERRLFGDD